MSLLPYFFAIGTNLIFSLHYLVVKDILGAGFSPVALGAWRGLVGGGLLLFLYRHHIDLAQWRQHGKLLFGCALTGFFINQYFFMIGMPLTSTMEAAMLSNFIPVFTALMAMSLGLEVFRWKKIAGIILGFVIVLYLIMDRGQNVSPHSLQNFFKLGNLYIMINVFIYCISVMFSKKLLSSGFSFQVLAGFTIFSGGFGLSFLAGKEMIDVIPYLMKAASEGREAKAIFNFVFELLMATSLVYLLHFYTLKKLGPLKISYFTYSQPMMTALMAFIFLGEVPLLSFFIALIGIVLSGYLVLS